MDCTLPTSDLLGTLITTLPAASAPLPPLPAAPPVPPIPPLPPGPPAFPLQSQVADLTGADLLVSAVEWAELAKPGPELRGFMRSHSQLPGLHWRQVTMEPAKDPGLAPFTGSLDVMGDGSLTLLPTPATRPGRCRY